MKGTQIAPFPFTGGGGGGSTSDFAVGILGVTQREPMSNGTWDGTYYTKAIRFNQPTIISNAGGGDMLVSASGQYHLQVYNTLINNGGVKADIRATIDGVEIPDSQMSITENGSDNDHDFWSTGIIFDVVAGEKIRVENMVNSGGDDLQSDAKWTLIKLGGVPGQRGVPGVNGFDSSPFRVFANSSPTNQLFNPARYAFEKDDATLFASKSYDFNNIYDLATGLFIPLEGIWNFGASFGLDDVGTGTRHVNAFIRNMTTATDALYGSGARSTDTDERNRMVISGDIECNGIDEYQVQLFVNNSAADVLGTSAEFFFSGHRVYLP